MFVVTEIMKLWKKKITDETTSFISTAYKRNTIRLDKHKSKVDALETFTMPMARAHMIAIFSVIFIYRDFD